MINITIFFNCHGNYIYFYLKQYLPQNKYNINFIYIAEFLGGGGNREYFNESEIDIFKNTDILIIQYIKNNRDFLNHENIIKLTKDNTITIKIPHYTYHGYNYKPLCDIISESSIYNKNIEFKIIKNIIDTEFEKLIFNKDTFINFEKYKDDCLSSIIDNDILSDIKMYNIFIYYYKKHILFNEPWHPNSFFYI
jgi:hypothetical protein